MSSNDTTDQPTGLRDAMRELGRQARRAARALARWSGERRAEALQAMATALDEARPAILEANAADMAAGEESGLSSAMLDRLRLDPGRCEAMSAGLRFVAELPDPVGTVLDRRAHPLGLRIERRRVPIGVIAMIYESRPNVTVDAAGLCLRAGNAIILRGGREARHSNRALADALLKGGAAVGLPAGAIQLVATTDRAAVRELVRLDGLVDLVIPRGGEGLIRAVTEQATVPVIKHSKGVCHIYVDGAADPDKALAICENAKVQRPGVCNAMETLLVDRAIAGDWLPRLATALKARGVELRGDAEARAAADDLGPATEADWQAEYLDLILAIRVVDGVEGAIEHIASYGSGHSDAIVSEDAGAANAFIAGVDSAAVYVNASTRFTDGGEFGMGAEIGIATGKMHARGPVGVEQLTSFKYRVRGSGQIRP